MEVTVLISDPSFSCLLLSLVSVPETRSPAQVRNNLCFSTDASSQLPRNRSSESVVTNSATGLLLVKR